MVANALSTRYFKADLTSTWVGRQLLAADISIEQRSATYKPLHVPSCPIEVLDGRIPAPLSILYRQNLGGRTPSAVGGQCVKPL